MSKDPIDIHDPAFAEGPFPTYRSLREERPAVRSDLYGGFTLLTRYADVKSAAVDWRTYTSSVVGVTAIPIITPRDKPMLPIELDPPKHSAYRAVVKHVFSNESVAKLRPEAEALSERLLRPIVEEGESDVVAAYTDPFSCTAPGF